MKNLIILIIILFTVLFPISTFAQNGKPEFIVQTGHTNMITALAFSADGRTLASSSYDNTIKLWHVASGRELRTLVTVPSYESKVSVALAFSPDGKTLASVALVPSIISLWDVYTGKELKRFNNDGSERISSIVFSPDGKLLATGSDKSDISLWNIESGQKLKILSGHIGSVSSIVFSPDGRILASGSKDKNVKLWDTASGKELKTFTGHDDEVSSIVFSRNGKKLISKNIKGSRVIIWDISTGEKLLRDFPDVTLSARNVGFLPDGEAYILSGFYNLKLNKIKDLDKVKESEPAKSLDQLKKQIEGFNVLESSMINAISPDGAIYASAQMDLSIKLRNVAGEEINTVAVKASSVRRLNFTENGEILAIVFFDGKVIIWNTAVIKGIQSFNLDNNYGDFWSMAVSTGGKIIAVGNGNKGIDLWDVASGKKSRTLLGHTATVFHLAFSPDGKTLASSGGETVKLWNVDTGKELKSIQEKNSALGADPILEREILPIVPDYNRRNFYDATTPNGKFKVRGGENGQLDLLDAKTDKFLANLYILGKSDWVIATPDGRFDTNKLENPQGLHWKLPDAPLTPLSFELFMRDYFEPKLLPRLLKCTEEANCDREFKPVRDLSSLNRTQPRVEIKEIKKTASTDTVEVTVEAENITSQFQKGVDKKALDSGVFDLRLFRDGQLVEYSTTDANLQKTFRAYKDFDEELKVWREANKVDLKNGKKTFSFQVKLPNNAGEKPIEFSAYAFNDDRVKSETSRKTFTMDKDGGVQPRPRKAYVITFGVNKYDNAEWNLQFAGNDARAMREIFSAKLRGRKEFAETVEIPLISDDEIALGKIIEKRDATKGNVRTVLDLLSGKTVPGENLKSLEKAVGAETIAKIKQANPDDMVLLSFSSHGYADKNGVFYILPGDIGKDSGKIIDNQLLARFISSDELSLWLRDVDAGEMVMIVDACYAASAVEGKDFKPAPMGSRGLGQLAFDKGMKILTATQAANVAIETGGSIGHGLLSYALLKEGLEKTEADFKPKDKTINLREWLEFGEYFVPNLYKDVLNGKRNFIGKGVGNSGASKQKGDESIQQPTLFDFTRKSEETTLVRLP